MAVRFLILGRFLDGLSRGKWRYVQLLVGLLLGLLVAVFFNLGAKVRPIHMVQWISQHEWEDSPRSLVTNSPSRVQLQESGNAPISYGGDNVDEARRLEKEVRVLVWVMTHPPNHQSKARMVRDTWGKRANRLLFFSSTSDPSIPTIKVDVGEGRQHLTAKSQKAWRYIYQNHFHDADWFMKADDNTYVIMENLRYFLSGENKSEAVHFGQLYKAVVKQGFYSGGSGYVLSKEAFRRYGEKGMKVTQLCRQDGAAEDAAMGHCMEKLGVRVANTTDALGRSRFHSLKVEHHLTGTFPPWYYIYDANGAKFFQGMNKMSDYPISFHYLSPDNMLVFEYLIYHVSPYGIVKGLKQLNKPHHTNRSTQWTEWVHR